MKNRFLRWRRLYALLLPILAIGTHSCNNNSTLPGLSAAGAPGEVLLVMDSDWLNGEAGELVKEALETEVPALPQVEYWLRVQTVKSEDYGSFLRNTRNILIVDHNPKTYSQTSVKFAYDPHAVGQIVVTIQTPNKASLEAYLKEHSRDICELFLRNELFRMAEDLSEAFSQKADELCKEVFGYHINLPPNMLSSKKGKDFLWLSNNTMRKRSDAVIFRLPYSGERSLKAENLIALRDSVLGANIPGSVPQTHMSTSNYGSEYRTGELPNGRKFFELRGLWEMTDPDMMAGPFVAHIFIDAKEEMLYYLEGFVYHPNEKKRDLVRLLEAALYTFRPASEGIYSPEEIKRVKWSAPIDLTASEPTFTQNLSPSK